MNWALNTEGIKMFRIYDLRDWLDSKFGINRPKALPLGEWDTWRTETKSKYPFKFFMAETLPDVIEDVVEFFIRPLRDARYWVRYRTVDKYHLVNTKLKPDYYDKSIIMLHANMELLRDHVEVDLAWRNWTFDVNARTQYKMPWFTRGWFKFKKWRSPEAGLDYLNWETKLVYDEDTYGAKPGDKLYGKPTDQALRAKEILEIYNWWTTVYPNRPDPMDASGWSAHCDRLRAEGKSMFSVGQEAESKVDRTEGKKALDKMRKIEKQYSKEEEQMLVRLMKIRQGLWI